MPLTEARNYGWSKWAQGMTRRGEGRKFGILRRFSLSALPQYRLCLRSSLPTLQMIHQPIDISAISVVHLDVFPRPPLRELWDVLLGCETRNLDETDRRNSHIAVTIQGLQEWSISLLGIRETASKGIRRLMLFDNMRVRKWRGWGLQICLRHLRSVLRNELCLPPFSPTVLTIHWPIDLPVSVPANRVRYYHSLLRSWDLMLQSWVGRNGKFSHDTADVQGFSGQASFTCSSWVQVRERWGNASFL